MPTRYVALLRAISNVSMQPFRAALEELGFTDVESYGMSGNFLFNATPSDTGLLERVIAKRLGCATFVRTRQEMAKVVAADPFGSAILFLARAPTATRRRRFLDLEFEGPRPVLRGHTLFFVYPARLRGKRTPTDFERILGVQGTARSARVVHALLARLS